MSRKTIFTSHGNITTPVFMPVGTAASVKSLSPQDLEDLGAQIILANTYHLHLRSTESLVKQMGGLHRFMNWTHPILTDSGGFQVHSLSPRITEEGVTFKSHLDGSTHFLSPEKSIQIQMDLGADIIMAFDECTPTTDKAYTKASMERTHRWLARSKSQWRKSTSTLPLSCSPALFGIIQGGKYKDLRVESAKFIIDQNLSGIAIGGQSIGSDPQETAEVISWIRDLLPKDKPLYAMGVGAAPSHISSVIKAGADMFDCVAPTRLARCGLLYHPDFSKERIDINKAIFANDHIPLLPGCDCYTCQSGFSRAYLHHLFRSRELLYYRLASIHNLRTMIRTVEKIKS